MLTLRRLVVFWLLVVAVSALVRSTPRRAIPAFIGLSSAVYLLIGIANELRLGTFAPFVSDYRFAGTLHPNHQGVNCAMLALSGVWYLSSRQARWRALAVGFVVFGVAFLLLTKSRTAFATFVGAALLVPVLQLRPRRRFIVATVIVNLGILLLLLYWYGALDPLLELFLLGRGGQDLGSLNSRLPLWRLLWDYAAERPLLGYGYSGFMTERHAAEIAVLERFGVAGAHSLYLEVMLGVGLVGLSFLLATFIMAIVTGFRDSGREIPSPEALFVAILVYELLNGILESTILMPSWRLIPLIVLGTLCLAPGATAPVRRR